MAALRAFEAEQDAARMASQSDALQDLADGLKPTDEFFDVAGANVGGVDLGANTTGQRPQEYHTLGRVAFMSAMNELIKKLDTAKAHKTARELEVRIESGQDKIKAAFGKAPEDALRAAQTKLDGLKAELLTLRRDLIVPHYMVATIHSLLDANDRQNWPLTAPGQITINLPGVFNMAVEIPIAEIPF